MRRLLLLAAVTALAVARPELYKEKEDFQFTRSSSDDGTKAGFYGAQRGNMGGNYERAHNMDTVAQHQMGGLVRQVEGELGDGSKTRTGSVYSAANSRGIYGSGQYDLSKLEGRNFQEGVTYDDSQSHSSLASHNSDYTGQLYSSSNSAGYGGRHSQSSRYHGYQAAGHSDQTLQSSNLQASSLQASNLQASNSLQGSNQYDYDRQASHNTGYYTKSDVHDQNVYDRSNSNLHSSSGYGSNAQTRYIANPVRIVITPGTRVAIPVAAQNYDSALASSYGENAVNSEADVLRSTDQQTIYKPSSEPKRYESSYSYRKEWEKHDTKPAGLPLAVPTVYPFPKNSELYEDTQSQATDHQFEANRLDSHAGAVHSSNAYNGYNANVNSASSSQTQRQSKYNAQHQSSSLGMDQTAHTQGGYNSGAATSLNNQIDEMNTQPKSYQSSYSYHKSWERQGDPYVIKPASNGLYDGQLSQKLSAELNNRGASHQHGSNYHHSHQKYAGSNDDCDEEGHIRVARSYRVAQSQEDTPYQQTQNIYGGQEDLGQQTQNGWQNYEDLGQQSQNKWDNIEDLGQQSQNKWDNLEILGQQAQNLDNGGQQTQNKWDKLEDLGQQAQNPFDQQNMGQESQNTWDNLDLSQQSQTDLGQQTQDTWSIMATGPEEHIGVFETRENPNNLGQRTQDLNKEAQTQETPEGVPVFNIFSLHDHQSETQPALDKVHAISNKDNHDIQTTQQDTFTSGRVEHEPFEHIFSQREDLSQQSKDSWNNIQTFDQNTYPNKQFWEQTADSTHQVSLNADSEMHTNQSNLFNYHNVDLDQQTQTHGNQFWNTHTGFQNSWQLSLNDNNNFYSQLDSSSESPLSSLWNKIDGFEKQFSDKRDNLDTQHFQNLNHNLEQVHTASNTDLIMTETSKNKQFTSNTENVSSQSNTFIATTSTTENPEVEESILHYQDKLRPLDIGRGDIGPEDLFNDTSITEKTFNLFDDKLDSSNKNKTDKTQAEIESLTLSETGKTNKLDNKMNNTNKYSIYQHNYQQEKKNEEVTELNGELSVLSLNQQKIINNQMLHELPSSSTVRTLKNNDDSFIDTHGIQSINGQTQNKNIEMLDDKIDLHEKQNLTKQVTEVSTSNFTFDDIQHYGRLDQTPVEIEPQNINNSDGFREPKRNYENSQNMEQQFEHFGQESESFNQQSEGFGQQSESLGQQSLDLGQHSEDFGQLSEVEQYENLFDFGQQNEKLDQQSQTVWSENLEGLNQQIQTASKPNNNLQQGIYNTDQQHPNQQIEVLEQQSKNSDELSQTALSDNLEDHNKQVQTASKPNNNLYPQQAEKFETQSDVYYKEHQSSNHNNQNIDKTQSVTPKNIVLELPPEPPTEKPGFWKSVGTKFVSAKDKVYSWFGS